MTKRGGRRVAKIDPLNPFEQYGDQHHRPSRMILFDDDPRNDPWLDALELFDRGDKSALIELLKSGYPMPPAIAPHIGDVLDRYEFKRPAGAPRKASYDMSDTDAMLNAADIEVVDLLSIGWRLADAIAAIAKKRGIPVSKMTEHHAKRRRSQRKR